MQLPQHSEEVLGVRGVEVAGRFVGQQELRFGDQRPGHRTALLLPARELVGEVAPAWAKSDFLDEFGSRRERG
jgi:hypothetical protein